MALKKTKSHLSITILYGLEKKQGATETHTPKLISLV